MDVPYSFDLDPLTGLPSAYDNHIERRLSAMQGQYLNEAALQVQLGRKTSCSMRCMNYNGRMWPANCCMAFRSYIPARLAVNTT